MRESLVRQIVLRQFGDAGMKRCVQLVWEVVLLDRESDAVYFGESDESQAVSADEQSAERLPGRVTGGTCGSAVCSCNANKTSTVEPHQLEERNQSFSIWIQWRFGFRSANNRRL